MIPLLLINLVAASGMWLDVPFVRQPEKGCGSAVVWMVLQYWSAEEQRPDSGWRLEDIHRRLYSEDKGGVSTSEMQRFFQSLNYRAYSFRGEWPDLEHHLLRGRPIIVGIKPTATELPHFVAVTGMDTGRDVLLVNDPAGRKLQKISRADFERQWNLADNWTLLALPQ
jgi:ABC-type bacteriocin/lantibiotic exporter with double-glycine peptidase domain